MKKILWRWLMWLDKGEDGMAKREIEVAENDDLVIPIEQTEQTETPGVIRIKPNAALREWVKRQAAIKIID